MSALEAALGLLRASKPLPVIPACWTGTNGVCAPHGAGCRDLGKVPLVSWKLYQEWLPTEEEVKNWWSR